MATTYLLQSRTHLTRTLYKIHLLPSHAVKLRSFLEMHFKLASHCKVLRRSREKNFHSGALQYMESTMIRCCEKLRAVHEPTSHIRSLGRLDKALKQVREKTLLQHMTRSDHGSHDATWLAIGGPLV